MPRQDSPLGPEFEDLSNQVTNDNLLKTIRLRRLLSPNPDESTMGLDTVAPSLPQGNMMSPISESRDYSNMNQMSEEDELISKLYKPQTEWENRYESHVNAMPNREDSKPSMLRKILAGMYGGLTMSPSIASDIMDQPHQTKMRDWETRRKALEPGLTAERFSNQNARQAAQSTASNKIAQDRADTAAQRVEDQRTRDQARTDQEKAELALKQMIANKPDLELVENESDGKLYGVDKDSGKTFEIPGITKLTEAKKIELGIAGRVKIANIQGQNALNRTREVGEQARLTVNERERARKERLTKDKQLSITQDAAAYKLARQQYLTDNPGSAQFFYDDGTPTAEATKSGKEDEYVDAVEGIRERYNNIKGSSGRQSVDQPDLPRTNKNNQVRMMTPPDAKGQTRIILVPSDKVKEAEGKGAKVLP